MLSSIVYRDSYTCLFYCFEGYNDTGEYWRSVYDTPTFQQDLQELMEQLKPLYEQLHAYVRKKLRNLYGAEHFPASGHIPAHLLGNEIWAQLLEA